VKILRRDSDRLALGWCEDDEALWREAAGGESVVERSGTAGEFDEAVRQKLAPDEAPGEIYVDSLGRITEVRAARPSVRVSAFGALTAIGQGKQPLIALTWDDVRKAAEAYRKLREGEP
jgi:hypothetical protein